MFLFCFIVSLSAWKCFFSGFWLQLIFVIRVSLKVAREAVSGRDPAMASFRSYVLTLTRGTLAVLWLVRCRIGQCSGWGIVGIIKTLNYISVNKLYYSSYDIWTLDVSWYIWYISANWHKLHVHLSLWPLVIHTTNRILS